MAAPLGNKYWKLRSKDGRDKIFKTPEDLLNACNEYFQWVVENPLIEIDYRGKDLLKVQIPKMRPFTLEGLCNFLDISVDAFKLYEERKDFIGVTTRARQIIYNQKFEGAAAGFLNANIIARDLGLADHKDHTTGGKPIAPAIDLSQYSDDELRTIAELQRKGRISPEESD